MPDLARRARRFRVRSIVALGVVLVAGVSVGPALAAPPADRVERIVESGTEVDEFLTEECGATITRTFTVRETTVFFDPGSELPHQHMVQFSATLSGPGGTLIERSAWRELDTEESATFTGLPFRLLSPDGGVLIRDAGLVTFTEDGIEVVHGPHPFLFEGFDFCSYLV
jgi:hypothetical protein